MTPAYRSAYLDQLGNPSVSDLIISQLNQITLFAHGWSSGNSWQATPPYKESAIDRFTVDLATLVPPRQARETVRHSCFPEEMKIFHLIR